MSLDNIENQSDAVEQDPCYADLLLEEAAFERLLPDLLTTIPGRYVAVLDGKVIDQDKNQFKLAERISGQYPERFVLIQRVSREPEDYYASPGDNIAEQAEDIEQDRFYADSLREEAAFERLLPDLLNTIPGLYAAVLDGKVIDQDANQFALAERISGEYRERFVLIRRVSREPGDFYAPPDMGAP